MMDFQGRAAGSAAARGGGPGGGPAAGHAASAPVAGLPAQPPAAAAGGGGAEAGGGKVAFRVMMKRGGREDRTRELRIPVTAGMAALLAQKEAAEAAEKAELKRLVLEANKRDLQVD